MKVIIIKPTAKFNKIGDTVEVKSGYARNFLIPQGFALSATAANTQRIEEIRKQDVKKREGLKKGLFEIKEKIDAISLTLTSQVKEDEEIYGSINELQLIKSLADEGIEWEKGAICLPETIKKLGVYNLKVVLDPEVEANLRVWVVKK